MTIFPERLKDLDVLVAGNLKKCMKRPIPVRVIRIDKEFRVKHSKEIINLENLAIILCVA